MQFRKRLLRRGTEPREGSFQSERENETTNEDDEEKRGSVRVSPECIDSTVPQFFVSPSFSVLSPVSHPSTVTHPLCQPTLLLLPPSSSSPPVHRIVPACLFCFPPTPRIYRQPYRYIRTSIDLRRYERNFQNPWKHVSRMIQKYFIKFIFHWFNLRRSSVVCSARVFERDRYGFDRFERIKRKIGK